MGNEVSRGPVGVNSLDRSPGKKQVLTRKAVANRWPHIARYLRVDRSDGWIEDRYFDWHFANESVEYPNSEYAAASEEWADFYTWRLERRLPEFANDRSGRYFIEQWTDGMIYLHKRIAAQARGEDPGESIPQHERRPDLDAELWAIVDEISARLDAQRQRKAG